MEEKWVSAGDKEGKRITNMVEVKEKDEKRRQRTRFTRKWKERQTGWNRNINK